MSNAARAFCAGTDLPFPRPEPAYAAKRVRDLGAFGAARAGLTPARVAELDALLADATVLDMQAAMARGALTSAELVAYYVDRIRRYDIDRLNAVLELNPQALEIARQRDAERAAGSVRGAMHGIPVLLKDNIATGDGMHTTAGAYALKDWRPDRDAFQVQQLRAAGAVILGKANLSEWANWMDKCMPNGFSTLGGQTRNPYGPFETYGSSSGSAVAVAANLAAVSVGSETQGSIIMPAKINSVVGLKTSMGLVSRDYVVPLLEWQDVTGPMGRCVTDVAVLLTAMTGVDANDPATQDAATLAGFDFTRSLTAEAAAALRVGVVIQTDEAIEQLIAEMKVGEEQVASARQALHENRETQRLAGRSLQALGLPVVEIDAAALPAELDVVPALTYGFRDAINRFLATLGDGAGVASLDAIVERNAADPANRAPYGQGHLLASRDCTLGADAYLAIRDNNRRVACEGVRRVLAEHKVDVLIGDVDQLYAPAGFPAISVPAGYAADGRPADITMVADFLGEPALIAAAYAFEQATQARRAPDLEATLRQIE